MYFFRVRSEGWGAKCLRERTPPTTSATTLSPRPCNEVTPSATTQQCPHGRSRTPLSGPSIPRCRGAAHRPHSVQVRRCADITTLEGAVLGGRSSMCLDPADQGAGLPLHRLSHFAMGPLTGCGCGYRCRSVDSVVPKRLSGSDLPHSISAFKWPFRILSWLYC